MKLTVTVDIPDETLALAATRAVESAFAPPAYKGYSGGEAYEEVQRQAVAAVATLDLEPLIRARIDERLESIVDDVLEAVVRRRVQVKVKEMGGKGRLFGEGKATP